MSANVNEACIAHRVANEVWTSLPIKDQTWEPGISDGHTDEDPTSSIVLMVVYGRWLISVVGTAAEVKVVVTGDADEIGNGVLGLQVA